MSTTALTSMYRDVEILQLVSRAPDTFVSTKNWGPTCIAACYAPGAVRQTGREDCDRDSAVFLTPFSNSRRLVNKNVESYSALTDVPRFDVGRHSRLRHYADA